MCPPEFMTSLQDKQLSRRRLFQFGGAAMAAAAAATFLPGGRAEAAEKVSLPSFSHVMDLTQTLSTDTPLFLGVPGYIKVEPGATHAANGYYVNMLTYWEHAGTHIDAPIHCSPTGLYVDEIPLSSLIVPAVVIDISKRAARDPDALVTADDIRAWERRYGRLPKNAGVLMYSGWETRLATPGAYQNADSSGVQHFPGFSLDAAQFLMNERSISGIGVDTLSLDRGVQLDFAVHYAFLPTNRWGLEGMVNLSKIPPSGATLLIGAPKVKIGSGGPSRIMAFW